MQSRVGVIGAKSGKVLLRRHSMQIQAHQWRLAALYLTAHPAWDCWSALSDRVAAGQQSPAL